MKRLPLTVGEKAAQRYTEYDNHESSTSFFTNIESEYYQPAMELLSHRQTSYGLTWPSYVYSAPPSISAAAIGLTERSLVVRSSQNLPRLAGLSLHLFDGLYRNTAPDRLLAYSPIN